MTLSKEQQLIINTAHIKDYTEVGGGEVRANCPFCFNYNHKPYKFYMNEDGLNLCFKCGWKGNTVSFVQEYLNTTYHNARDYVKQHGMQIERQRLDYNTDLFSSVATNLTQVGEPISRKVMPPLPTNTFSLRDNINVPSAIPFITYLSSRGVSNKQILNYDIRYCIQGQIKTKQDKIINVNNSLIFVAHNALGEPIYWNTRSIEPYPYLKTLNANSKGGYTRKDALFGIDKVRPNDKLVIVESVFNALTINDIYNNLKAVATYGKMVTSTQLSQILNLKPSCIYLGLDPDAVRETAGLYNRLRELNYNGEIYLVEYPNSEDDFNSLGKKQSIQLLRNAKIYENINTINKTLVNNLS